MRVTQMSESQLKECEDEGIDSRHWFVFGGNLGSGRWMPEEQACHQGMWLCHDDHGHHGDNGDPCVPHEHHVV